MNRANQQEDPVWNRFPTGSKPIPRGPDNPHPLSTLGTELVWEGKYDAQGRRVEPGFNRLENGSTSWAIPLEKIEAIDGPRAQPQGSLVDSAKAQLDAFRNMLILGDNKLVMASLLEDFTGKIDLIYIDPPFDVGGDFTVNVAVGSPNRAGKEAVEEDRSSLDMVAYRDTWGRGTDSYIHMMYERLSLMKELLSERGTLWVHCDWRVNYLLRAVLGEIFGSKNFLNEVVWWYRTGGVSKEWFGRKHDTLLAFCKSMPHHTFNPQFGGEFKTQGMNYDEKGHPYKTTRKGRLYFNPKGPQITSVWDLPFLSTVSDERLGYETQKPEALLERIIQACSNEGDLVADFFCGSGTTGAVAQRLNRRWIMCDLGRFALHTSRKRLIGVQRKLHDDGKACRAFDVLNLGVCERRWWSQETLHGADEEHRRVVLESFRAEVLTSARSPLIHGRRAGTLCHVDGIDSVFTRKEARAVAEAVAEAGEREIHCLAWEFEMDLRRATPALEEDCGVRLVLIQIPREIMEKNRKRPPPFPQMALLEAEPVYHGKGKDRTVDIKLVRFMPSPAELPGGELDALKERAVHSGFDFIDLWAADFDWAPDRPFNHHWQDYRTRKDRSLETVSRATHKYGKPGTYTACVKVVDVFGCDTSITVKVQV